jgi:hypothetical protein
VPRGLGSLFKLVANRVLVPLLSEGLVYWRAERLYWEGVTHPDGGDRDEQEEISAAEGAETALLRLADILGIDPARMPGEDATHEAGLRSLRKRLEADERSALVVLDRLGPSRRIPVAERMPEYVEANDAESKLARADRIWEYLEWLAEADGAHTERKARATRETGG